MWALAYYECEDDGSVDFARETRYPVRGLRGLAFADFWISFSLKALFHWGEIDKLTQVDISRYPAISPD